VPVPRLWAATLVVLVVCLLASMVIAIVKLS
jgi:preprotein translocase subunit SecE